MHEREPGKKEKCLDFVRSGYNVSKVASLFVVSRKTVQRWMKGSERPYPYVTEQYMDNVLTEYQSEPTLTVEAVGGKVTKAFPDFNCS